MALKNFRLPDPGEGLTEAEIVTWKVKPGDTVKVNDIVVEIETAKSLVELPVPFAGTVTELLAEEGSTVEVGTPIIAVDTSGGTAPPPAAAPSEPVGAAAGATVVTDAPAEGAVEPGMVGSPAPKAEEEIEQGKIGGTTSTGRTAVLVGYGVKQTEAKRRPRKAAVGIAPHQRGSGRALAKPPVRKFAKDLGVDLDQVHGSGEGGIITRGDVEAHAGTTTSTAGATTAGATTAGATTAPQPRAGGAAAAYGASTFGSGEREERIPVKGVRKVTAQAMVGSAFTAPHVTEWVTVDVTATVELIERLKQDREFVDVKVTPLLVLAKALCVALRRNPGVNATWDEQAQEIVQKNYVNLGIAAATPRGLVVPNVKDADRLSMRQLAEAIGALTATAREGRTQPAEMSGGTITITNVGVFGVDSGTPIINPGESAILCFGQIRRMPWVVSAADGTEQVVPRSVTQLALSFDHRLIDGELGSRFLADVAAILHDPARGLVWG